MDDFFLHRRHAHELQPLLWLHKADVSTPHSRGDPPWMRWAPMYTTITARWVLLVALADLCRDRTCKKPKGQALFFLVDDGNPEMLPALGAEELGDMLEGTML